MDFDKWFILAGYEQLKYSFTVLGSSQKTENKAR